MQASNFSGSNKVFGPPPGYSESQIHPIPAFVGEVPPLNNMEGAAFIVVAWKPSEEDIKRIAEGGLVYLSCIGSLPPHFITTEFEQATYKK